MIYNGLDEFFKETKIPDKKSSFDGLLETEEELKSSQELLLMCKVIQESLLRGLNDNLVKENVRKMVIPDKIIRENLDLITEIVHDPLLKTKVITYPEYYKKCSQNREYLDKIHLKVPFIRALSRCRGCNNNINGYCIKIGGKILDNKERIPGNIIVQKINEMLHNSPNLAKECCDLENYSYLQGLNAAIIASKKKPDKEYNRQKSAANDSNSLTHSLSKCVNKKDGKVWTKIQLDKGLAVSAIQKILTTKFGSQSANKIIREVVEKMKVISADALDNCRNYSYDLSNDTRIIKTAKCRNCEDSRQLWCGKTGVQFSPPSSVIEDCSLTPEAKEIMSFYKGSNAEITICQEPVRESIEIEFDNPGAHMVVDTGSNTKNTDIDLQDLCLNSRLGDITINSDRDVPPTLDIEGFGGMGDLPDGVV